MSRDATIYAGRRAAESLMTDTFAAYSPGAMTKDADNYDVPGFRSEGETRGKLSGRSREGDPNSRTVSVGGVERVVVEGGLHIPLSSPAPIGHPTHGWEYVCVEVGPSSDPGLLGRRFRVVDAPMKSHATARRLDVIDITK